MPTFTAAPTTVVVPATFVYDVLVLTSDSNATAQSKINGASSTAIIGFDRGVHYERKVTGRLGQTYRGHPDGTTVFDGSRAVTGWTGSNPWVANHTITDRGVFIDTTGQRTATGDDVGSQYPEELFFATNGANTGWTRKQRQGQPTTGAPSAGKWTMDYAGGTLRVAEDPTTTQVRISVTDTAIVAPILNPGGMVIEDITFQKYATDIWHSAAGHGSDHRDWTYRRVAMLDCHGSGFYLGPGDVVTRCKSSYQGFEGMDSEGEAGGYSAPITITDTEWSYNMRARYNWGWEGGGSKFDVPTGPGPGLTIRNCWIHDNQGVGVWFDINLTETSTNTVESNLFERNEFADIDVEISNGTYIIRWNECRETGNIANNGGDPSQSLDVAILINNSRGCQVYENKLVDLRRGGIEGDDDDRDPFLDSASFQRNHVKSLGVGNGSYAAKLRFATNNARIGTCGYDDNKYWSSASTGFRYAPNDLSFAGWQAVRTGPGLTGALDPNGQAGLTGTVTDPPNFVAFVAQPRYGPGV